MREKLLLPITLLLLLTACSTTPSFKSSRPDKDIQASATKTKQNTANTKEISAQQETVIESFVNESKYGDVWIRIRDQLSLKRHVDNKAVKDKIAWYARHQQFLDRVAERATPYIYFIVEEIEKRNMPMELALLPIVESAYHPFAYSRSHASGIWQFIPGTGKVFGLKQNWWYDGRRDIVASTRAALDYLQKLHTQFNDWELAIAAYNTGERNIEKAVNKNTQSKKKTDFFSLGLHKETRGYVPSLLAVAEIIAEPEKYGIKLAPIPDKPYFAQIETGGQLDLSAVASLTGLSMDQIYTLNPGFSRWATDPDGPHYLLVPLDKKQLFVQGLSSLPKEQRVSLNQHVIKKDETLGQIADMYKTSVAMLKEANKLKGHLIREGQTLMIPGSINTNKSVASVRDNPHVVGLVREPVGNNQMYAVLSGDNLWAIGKQFGVNVKALMSWNGLTNGTTLRIGQKLKVGIQASPDKAVIASGKKPAAEAFAQNEESHIRYTVKKGDTLWIISLTFSVTVAQLQEWNKLSNKSLKPGQILVVLEAPALAAGD